MKLKTKLYIGFGLTIALMSVVFCIVFFVLEQQSDIANDLVEHRYRNVRLAVEVRNDMNGIAVLLRDVMLGKQGQDADQNFAQIDEIRQKANRDLVQLETLNRGHKTEEYVKDIRSLQTKYLAVENRARAMIKEGNQDSARLLRFEGIPIRDQLNAEIDQLCSYQEQAMEDSLQRMEQKNRSALYLLLGCFIAALIAGIFITLWVVRAVNRNVETVTRVMGSVNYNSLERMQRIEHVGDDEIGEIARAYNTLAATLEEKARHEADVHNTLEQQNWIKTQLAEVAMQNQGISTYEELGVQLITRLAKTIGASYGVFYLCKADKERSKLVKLASYAGSGQASAREEFMVGEGIVGQCALEQRPILLKNLPGNYIKIVSGLGSGFPSSIITIPTCFKGEVMAVIELASFADITDIQQEFLNQAADNIAVTLHRIESGLKIEQLLKESQTLTEELQTQSEELQMQQEELRSINEQLELQYKQSEEKTNELQITKVELEEKAHQVQLSSQYKSEFLANMSHELRTPLNSMLILAQILAENQEGNLFPNQVEFAKTISSSGSDLLNLINDILDLSKIESGKLTMALEEINITQLMNALHKKFQPLADKSGIEFNTAIESDVPILIYTDELRLQQILINLLSNAFKFTGKGSITCTVKKEIACSGNVLLAIAVADTGIGIPEDQQHIIFEAFQQADGTTTRKYGGTGLGLSICRKLAHLLGGYIELDSKQGEGSTFTLHLPVVYQQGIEDIDTQPPVDQEAAAAQEAEKLIMLDQTNMFAANESKEKLEEQSTLGRRKILLVDDDMRNVFALTTALETINLEVIFAENGREALDILEKDIDSSIDLVLMDIMMPEMDGYEAIRHIRNNPGLKEIPIIALTSKAMKADREKCLEVGASDYISKPVNVEKLYSLIKVWLYKLEK